MITITENAKSQVISLLKEEENFGITPSPSLQR